MNVTGIIAEYNPFHNGHKYQINEAKKNCDAVVAVMSGSFVQRGDVAVFDKWTRAQMALSGGADLIVELPVCYSLASAERFAYGAVSLTAALGVVDTLCFGSECGDISVLKKSAGLLADEPREVSETIQSLMKTGISYPSARQKAYSGYIAPEILTEPNNILALEYIKALSRLDGTIKPVTVKRRMTGHHSSEIKENFASASKIREMIRNGINPGKTVPWTQTGDIYNLSRLDCAAAAVLRTVAPSELAGIYDVGEGLENRIISAARECHTIDAIAQKVKTKRYTRSRINRILLSALLKIDKNLPKCAPEYIRVLGMSRVGCAVLADMKKKSAVPIITKTADFRRHSQMLQKDILATDIAALCADNPDSRRAGKDFTKSPIIYK